VFRCCGDAVLVFVTVCRSLRVGLRCGFSLLLFLLFCCSLPLLGTLRLFLPFCLLPFVTFTYYRCNCCVVSCYRCNSVVMPLVQRLFDSFVHLLFVANFCRYHYIYDFVGCVRSGTLRCIGRFAACRHRTVRLSYRLLVPLPAVVAGVRCVRWVRSTVPATVFCRVPSAPLSYVGCVIAVVPFYRWNSVRCRYALSLVVTFRCVIPRRYRSVVLYTVDSSCIPITVAVTLVRCSSFRCLFGC